jgi:hypothetical protein
LENVSGSSPGTGTVVFASSTVVMSSQATSECAAGCIVIRSTIAKATVSALTMARRSYARREGDRSTPAARAARSAAFTCSLILPA